MLLLEKVVRAARAAAFKKREKKYFLIESNKDDKGLSSRNTSVMRICTFFSHNHILSYHSTASLGYNFNKSFNQILLYIDTHIAHPFEDVGRAQLFYLFFNVCFLYLFSFFVFHRFGPVCPQRLPNIANETAALEKMPKGRLEYLRRLLPYLQNQSEDCLYLNIYVPIQGKKLDALCSHLFLVVVVALHFPNFCHLISSRDLWQLYDEKKIHCNITFHPIKCEELKEHTNGTK